MDKYKRKAIFSRLKGFCSFAKEDDFIEVTEWKNMEGFDVSVDNVQGPVNFRLTYGEFDLLKKMVKKLENK